MTRKEEDLLLQRIHQTGGIHPTPKTEDTLEYLADRGLLQKERDDNELVYTLTPYGEVICVMGFKTFQQTEKFEKKLAQTTPFKINLMKTAIVFLCLLLVSIITSITILYTELSSY